jgi:D-alanyl-D-alanine carboxypeptidase
MMNCSVFFPAIRTALLLFMLCLALPAHSGELNDAAFAELAKNLQVRLDSLREEQGFPGATAAVAFEDGRLIKLASGMANLEKGIAMTPDHRMPGGSSGKTYAAAVAVILEHEGLWDLDDRLEKYVGDRPWFHDIANQDTITLRQLLQHRSGLENWYDQPRFHAMVEERVKIGKAIDDFSREELIEFIHGVPQLFEPGKGYRYTDVGFILVGEAIEAVTGENYFDVLESRILDPLGLNLTAKSHQRSSGIAQGYSPNPSPLVPGVTHMIDDNGYLKFDPELEFTGGGLVNNPGDMARWVIALYTGRAISKDAAAAIVAPPQHLTGKEERTGNYYGLGVFVNNYPSGILTYGHGGWFPGYRSVMQYLPEHGFATAVQLNTELGTWAEKPPGPGEKRPSAELVQQFLQEVVLKALSEG